MTNETSKINLTGTNNSGLVFDGNNTTTKTNICKFEPIQGYQNVGSSKNLPCVKCGKQSWEHPIITYTQL